MSVNKFISLVRRKKKKSVIFQVCYRELSKMLKGKDLAVTYTFYFFKEGSILIRWNITVHPSDKSFKRVIPISHPKALTPPTGPTSTTSTAHSSDTFSWLLTMCGSSSQLLSFLVKNVGLDSFINFINIYQLCIICQILRLVPAIEQWTKKMQAMLHPRAAYSLVGQTDIT